MKKILAGISALILSLFFVSPAFALSFPSFQFASSSSVGNFVAVLLNWVVSIVGILAVVYLVYGGIAYLTSGGNEDRVKAAKNVILTAIIGLIIVVAAWLIVSTISKAVAPTF